MLDIAYQKSILLTYLLTLLQSFLLLSSAITPIADESTTGKYQQNFPIDPG